MYKRKLRSLSESASNEALNEKDVALEGRPLGDP